MMSSKPSAPFILQFHSGPITRWRLDTHQWECKLADLMRDSGKHPYRAVQALPDGMPVRNAEQKPRL
jgi:hypothetical protein